LRDREHEQRRGARNTVHQADQERAPAETMRMGMACWHAATFAGTTVGVEVNRAVAMSVAMEMHAVAPQPPRRPA
jgi:hypothetical protein